MISLIRVNNPSFNSLNWKLRDGNFYNWNDIFALRSNILRGHACEGNRRSFLHDCTLGNIFTSTRYNCKTDSKLYCPAMMRSYKVNCTGGRYTRVFSTTMNFTVNLLIIPVFELLLNLVHRWINFYFFLRSVCLTSANNVLESWEKDINVDPTRWYEISRLFDFPADRSHGLNLPINLSIFFYPRLFERYNEITPSVIHGAINYFGLIRFHYFGGSTVNYIRGGWYSYESQDFPSVRIQTPWKGDEPSGTTLIKTFSLFGTRNYDWYVRIEFWGRFNAELGI